MPIPTEPTPQPDATPRFATLFDATDPRPGRCAVAIGAARDGLAIVGRGSASSVRRAADAVIQALAEPRLSLEALRQAVIRYGRAAREVALAPDEMLGALVPQLRRLLAAHLPDRPELESWVEWWAIHGYHRAD